MMFRLSAAAQGDLEDRWLHIAQDNPQAADRLLDAIEKKPVMLAKHPHLGRKCDELGPNLHRFPADSCVIFYRIQTRHIETVRILHGARDIETVFKPPEE
jgi:toxin ParE1/3/4